MSKRDAAKVVRALGTWTAIEAWMTEKTLQIETAARAGDMATARRLQAQLVAVRNAA